MGADDMDWAPSPSPSCPDVNPKDNTLRIEGLVAVAVVAMFLLHVLGSLRRRSSNGLLHAIVMGTYTLSYALVSYTTGLMQSSGYYYREFTVWAVCLLLLLGSTDSLTACRLSDIDNWKSFYVRHLLQSLWVVWILVQFGPATNYQYPLWGILLVVLLKSHVRIVSMRTASKSYLLCKDVKAIADYMHHEHEQQLQQLPPYDAATMEGYRYVVTGERKQKYSVKRPEYMLRHKEDDMMFTTVEHIWQCTGSLLLRREKLKDVCLSMALSKMLNRRFAGFELAEAGLPKTHDFVFRGLLAGDRPYERAFRVIEVELAFVYDLYYTRYPYLYQKGRFWALYLPVLMLGLCSWLIYLIFEKEKDKADRYFARGATFFLMVIVAFLEAFQLYLYLASGWFKVAVIRHYVTTPRLQTSGNLSHMIMTFLLRLKALGAWEEKLGQYSFLSSFDGTPRCTNCLHYVTMRLVDEGKEGRKKEKLVKLSVEVKQAIVDSLLESKGDLTNGVRCLRNHGLHGHLSWACNGSATRTILVWHIATTLCKHQLDAQTKRNRQPAALSAVHTASGEVTLSEKEDTRAVHTASEVTLSEEDTKAVHTASKVASNLSRYCAYLVAFAPNLLPDHSSVSSLTLTESIKEARELLGGAKSMESKYQELVKIGAGDGHVVDDAPLVVLGARLASELMVMEPKLRWKVLSDFWAEMMLYVAPSDNALAHLEAMAKGGEFITHLWALLTHAGVLKQGPTGSPGDV